MAWPAEYLLSFDGKVLGKRAHKTHLARCSEGVITRLQFQSRQNGWIIERLKFTEETGDLAGGILELERKQE